jgi:hypothetical protein
MLQGRIRPVGSFEDGFIRDFFLELVIDGFGKKYIFGNGVVFL